MTRVQPDDDPAIGLHAVAFAENHYRAGAVALHVGSTLTFDITEKHIVIQLRGSSWRFLGGLHHYVKSVLPAC